MTWADVPAKLVTWQASEYYQKGTETEIDGAVSLFRQFGGTYPTLATVPLNRRADFEALLDHYNGAVSNLAVSRAIDPKLLRG